MCNATSGQSHHLLKPPRQDLIQCNVKVRCLAHRAARLDAFRVLEARLSSFALVFGAFLRAFQLRLLLCDLRGFR